MSNQELRHAGVKGMKWGVRRYQNADGTLTPAGRKRYGHDDYRKAHSRKSVKAMSDTELRSRNNRLQMEAQYRDLKKKTSRGDRAVREFIATAGLITATAGAVATYKKYGGSALSKVGNYVMNGIDLSGPLTK